MIEDLTEREREVVAGYTNGLSDNEIAADMGIAPSTVKTFGERIRFKLGAKTRAHVVAVWLRGNKADGGSTSVRERRTP